MVKLIIKLIRNIKYYSTIFKYTSAIYRSYLVWGPRISICKDVEKVDKKNFKE